MKKNLVAFKEMLSKLNYILMPKHKKKIVPMLIVVLLCSILELVGVSAILPFIQAVLNPEILTSNKLVLPILKLLRITSANGTIVVIGVCLICVYLAKNIIMIFFYFLQNDFSSTVEKDLSVKMLAAYLKHPYSYFLNVNSSELSRGCDISVGAVYTILSDLFTIGIEALTVLFISIFLIYTDYIIALSALSIMLLIMIIIIWWFKPNMKRIGEKYSKAVTEKTKTFNQTIFGVKEIYVMDRRDIFLKKYDEASDKLRYNRRNYAFLSATPERIVEGICVSGIIAVVLFRLNMNVDMTGFVPKLASFAVAAFKMLPSISKISTKINDLAHCQFMLGLVYKNILEADEYEKEIQEYSKLNALRDDNDELSDIEFENQLNISHVLWHYKDQEKAVLKDTNLLIRKNDTIGLIGKSGAGKTTLSDVILGLLKPQGGGVYMDGVDVNTIPRAWAKIIGYVPQSVYLLDESIRNNILFGTKCEKDDDVWKALERAQLADFVRSLPEGLNTEVGERGVRLSGGQRQRIAIARALYNRPQILVLDEATAALDNETEKAFMDSINTLKGQITLIIVAHRLTTIEKCNHIYRVEEGRIREVSHEDIMKK